MRSVTKLIGSFGFLFAISSKLTSIMFIILVIVAGIVTTFGRFIKKLKL